MWVESCLGCWAVGEFPKLQDIAPNLEVERNPSQQVLLDRYWFSPFEGQPQPK